jgi:hypothetical protein
MSRPTARDAAIAACSASALVHAWLAAVHFDERLLAASFAAAALALVAARHLLAEDLDAVVERGGRLWDWAKARVT